MALTLEDLNKKKDKEGNIYVCDSLNHAVRKIVPGRHHREAMVTTLAGMGV
jgi:hypothetical protein